MGRGRRSGTGEERPVQAGEEQVQKREHTDLEVLREAEHNGRVECEIGE